MSSRQPSLGAVCLAWLVKESTHPLAFLLPIRLFLGIGWLRAFTEKAINPAWHDGRALEQFLHAQMHTNKVFLPEYAWLIGHLFLPIAPVLAWLLIAGQLMVGLSLLFGAFTRLGLFGGLLMNFNFLLAGAINPSVFYIVIQYGLLVAGAGRIFGLDALAQKTNQIPNSSWRSSRLLLLSLAAFALLFACWSLQHAKDFSPHGSVADPAIVTAVACFVGVGHCLIALLRRYARVA